jgi:serine/threonine protein kinase
MNMPIDMKLLSTKVEDEVRIMAMVRDHPNVIKLEYGFRLGHSVFMCMELFLGHDLLTEIQNTGDGTGLGEEKARFYFRQLMEGVQYCRTQNIVHGDIKLENILVNKRGQLKLIDFGFAHVFIEGRNLEVSYTALCHSRWVANFFFSLDPWWNSNIFSTLIPE